MTREEYDQYDGPSEAPRPHQRKKRKKKRKQRREGETQTSSFRQQQQSSSRQGESSRKESDRNSNRGLGTGGVSDSSLQRDQQDKDDLLKQKMREADRVADHVLGVSNSNNNESSRDSSLNKKGSYYGISKYSSEDKDELLKQKMKEAERLADQILGVTPAAAPAAAAPKRSQREMDDDLVKKKTLELDQLALSVLSTSGSNVAASAQQHSPPAYQTGSSLNSVSEGGVASSQGYSPVAATNSRRAVMPLQPSMQRTSKIRVTSHDEQTAMTPGAYAIAGFNQASNNQNLMDDEDRFDPLVVFEDEDEEQSEEDEDDEETQEMFQPLEDQLVEEEDEDDSSASTISSYDDNEGDSDSQTVSTKSLVEGETEVYIDAEAVLVSASNGVKVQEGTIETKQQESFLVKAKNDATHRRWCRWFAVLFLVAPIIVALVVILTHDSGDSGDDESKDASSGPISDANSTLVPVTPTASPAPTVTMAPVTVIIWLDNAPEETGWTLKCNDETIASIPIKTYSDQPGELISETHYVPEGSRCTFTIFDFFDDGLCCVDGRGFYQVYVAEEDDIPNGLVGEGSDFSNSEIVRFTATPEEAPSASQDNTRKGSTGSW